MPTNWEQLLEQMPQLKIHDVKLKECGLIFQTSRDEYFRIEIKNWKGDVRLDIRKWFRPEDNPAALLPTKIGMIIPQVDIPEFIEILHRVLTEALGNAAK